MADLTPVVGDPFAGPVLAPVSGDPFAGQPSPFDKAPPTFADSPFASSGTLSSYEPNAADRLRVDASQGLQGLGASRGYADNFGTGLANVVSNSPLGAGMQVQDASRDFGQGNYTGAMLNGLGAAAALVPVGGSEVGAAERAVEPAVADAASKAINWDRSTVASGWPPMAGSQVVDVPVDAMEKAFQANKSQYVAKPNDAIMDHIAAGMPVSLPEVSASHGALNFQNGRNRFAAARDLGADTVPVSTDDPTALWNVLGKHGAAGSDLHATMLKRASDITLTPVSGNPFEGQ